MEQSDYLALSENRLTSTSLSTGLDFVKTRW